LLRYPIHGLQRAVGDPEEVAAFFDEIAIVDPHGLEELYTTTFDLNPVATLEIGWHLWGEQYERGRFLADLRGIQERIGITEATELPDHLTLLLPTIAVTDDEGLRDKCAKGLDKILIPLEEHGNPYRHLLRAVRSVLSPQSSVRLGGAA
jgi:nitrate reductase delta subunit